MSQLGPMRLPYQAFKCAVCGKICGECEHTRSPEGKPVRGARVLIAGLVEGFIDPMDTLFEMSEVVPCPMPMPRFRSFEGADDKHEPRFMEFSPSVVEPADKAEE